MAANQLVAVEPIREQILQAIVERLERIGLETGYLIAPRRVERRDMLMDNFNEFPVLLVIQSETSRVELYGVSGGQGNQFVHEYGVLVVGWVNGDDVLTPSTQLERLWDAVRLTLLKAATLGGLVRDIRMSESTSYAIEGTQGEFRQEFVVVYDESIDIP